MVLIAISACTSTSKAFEHPTHIVPVAVHSVLVDVRVCSVFVELSWTISVKVPRSLGVVAVTVWTSVVLQVLVTVGITTSVVVVTQSFCGRACPRPARSGIKANESIALGKSTTAGDNAACELKRVLSARVGYNRSI